MPFVLDLYGALTGSTFKILRRILPHQSVGLCALTLPCRLSGLLCWCRPGEGFIARTHSPFFELLTRNVFINSANANVKSHLCLLTGFSLLLPPYLPSLSLSFSLFLVPWKIKWLFFMNSTISYFVFCCYLHSSYISTRMVSVDFCSWFSAINASVAVSIIPISSMFYMCPFGGRIPSFEAQLSKERINMNC